MLDGRFRVVLVTQAFAVAVRVATCPARAGGRNAEQNQTYKRYVVCLGVIPSPVSNIETASVSKHLFKHLPSLERNRLHGSMSLRTINDLLSLGTTVPLQWKVNNWCSPPTMNPASPNNASPASRRCVYDAGYTNDWPPDTISLLAISDETTNKAKELTIGMSQTKAVIGPHRPYIRATVTNSLEPPPLPLNQTTPHT